ncbi:MAG: YraN family protein [Candidatus Levybacteria bacterium]|nr:YraN family protein [Candidatus Levybacteria bacterium]MDZ4228381.1 YraN family protein [Candidatus Levybacteria bacterium]
MKIANPTAKFGEDRACEYLEKVGFKILERNYRKTYGEIDIIAIDPTAHSAGSGQILAFIEVKTRTSDKFGSPLEAITYWKLRSLIKTAQYYKMSHRNLPESLRIDAVSVILNGNRVQSIELTRNISGF